METPFVQKSSDKLSSLHHIYQNEVVQKQKESHVDIIEKAYVYSDIKKEVDLEESEHTLLDVGTDAEEELPVINISEATLTEVHTIINEIVFLNDGDHEQFIDECLTSDTSIDISEEVTVKETNENKAVGSTQSTSPVPQLKQDANQDDASKCDVCNKALTNSSILSSHETIHSCIKNQCDECTKALTGAPYMTQCKLIHTVIKKHHCDVCNKAFGDAISLSLHKLIHRYQCDVCNKNFTFETGLLAHKALAQCAEKYECDSCYKVFSELKYLLQHKSIHSGIRYKCDVCNKVFTQERSLSDHKLIHTGVKKYKCDVCNKAFTQSSGLFVHKLIHTGNKKFKCDVCNKDFIRSYHLSVHKLTHSDVKQYKCDVCNRAFTRSDHLSRHKLKHARIK